MATYSSGINNVVSVKDVGSSLKTGIPAGYIAIENVTEHGDLYLINDRGELGYSLDGNNYSMHPSPRYIAGMTISAGMTVSIASTTWATNVNSPGGASDAGKVFISQQGNTGQCVGIAVKDVTYGQSVEVLDHGLYSLPTLYVFTAYNTATGSISLNNVTYTVTNASASIQVMITKILTAWNLNPQSGINLYQYNSNTIAISTQNPSLSQIPSWTNLTSVGVIFTQLTTFQTSDIGNMLFINVYGGTNQSLLPASPYPAFQSFNVTGTASTTLTNPTITIAGYTITIPTVASGANASTLSELVYNVLGGNTSTYPTVAVGTTGWYMQYTYTGVTTGVPSSGGVFNFIGSGGVGYSPILVSSTGLTGFTVPSQALVIIQGPAQYTTNRSIASSSGQALIEVGIVTGLNSFFIDFEGDTRGAVNLSQIGIVTGEYIQNNGSPVLVSIGTDGLAYNADKRKAYNTSFIQWNFSSTGIGNPTLSSGTANSASFAVTGTTGGTIIFGNYTASVASSSTAQLVSNNAVSALNSATYNSVPLSTYLVASNAGGTVTTVTLTMVTSGWSQNRNTPAGFLVSANAGFATSGTIPLGTSIVIQKAGAISGFSNLTAGTPVYVDIPYYASSGSTFTQNPQTLNYYTDITTPVGYAQSSSSIYVEMGYSSQSSDTTPIGGLIAVSPTGTADAGYLLASGVTSVMKSLTTTTDPSGQVAGTYDGTSLYSAIGTTYGGTYVYTVTESAIPTTGGVVVNGQTATPSYSATLATQLGYIVTAVSGLGISGLTVSATSPNLTFTVTNALPNPSISFTLNNMTFTLNNTSTYNLPNYTSLTPKLQIKYNNWYTPNANNIPLYRIDTGWTVVGLTPTGSSGSGSGSNQYIEIPTTIFGVDPQATEVIAEVYAIVGSITYKVESGFRVVGSSTYGWQLSKDSPGYLRIDTAPNGMAVYVIGTGWVPLTSSHTFRVLIYQFNRWNKYYDYTSDSWLNQFKSLNLVDYTASTTVQGSGGFFDRSSTNPTHTNRLNYDGNLYVRNITAVDTNSNFLNGLTIGSSSNTTTLSVSNSITNGTSFAITNASGGDNAYGQTIYLTGSASTNTALTLSATGATTNKALNVTSGSVNIGTSSPTTLQGGLTVNTNPSTFALGGVSPTVVGITANGSGTNTALSLSSSGGSTNYAINSTAGNISLTGGYTTLLGNLSGTFPTTDWIASTTGLGIGYNLVGSNNETDFVTLRGTSSSLPGGFYFYTNNNSTSPILISQFIPAISGVTVPAGVYLSSSSGLSSLYSYGLPSFVNKNYLSVNSASSAQFVGYWNQSSSSWGIGQSYGGSSNTVIQIGATTGQANYSWASGTSLAVTQASGSGSVATLTFATQATTPFAVGSSIVVSGMSPAGYNGPYTVLASTTSTVSYYNNTTGNATGTVTLSNDSTTQVYIPSTLASTSPTTGSLRVNGGVGIGGAVYMASTLTATSLTLAGSISGVTTLGLSGAISGATATNTINGVIINAGAVSNVTTLGLSGAISGATTTNTINGVIINAGAVSNVTTLAMGGAISGVTTLGLSGAISGATATNTINGVIINAGAVSNVTTLGLSGAISGATATNTINSVIINAGAVSGVTTLAMGGALSGVTTLGLSGAISGATATNTINSVIINAGAVSNVTTLAMGGALSGVTTLGMGGALSGVTTLAMGGALSGVTTLGMTGNLNGSTTGTTITAFSFVAGSQRKLKKEINVFEENAIDILNGIKVSSFFMKTDEENENFRIGFIADDTHEYLSSKNHDSMDIGNSIGLLLKAVQELSAEITYLKQPWWRKLFYKLEGKKN